MSVGHPHLVLAISGLTDTGVSEAADITGYRAAGTVRHMLGRIGAILTTIATRMAGTITKVTGTMTIMGIIMTTMTEIMTTTVTKR